jgi:hypothetical protein
MGYSSLEATFSPRQVPYITEKYDDDTASKAERDKKHK